jgi:hypothetical protein
MRRAAHVPDPVSNNPISHRARAERGTSLVLSDNHL